MGPSFLNLSSCPRITLWRVALQLPGPAGKGRRNLVDDTRARQLPGERCCKEAAWHGPTNPALRPLVSFQHRLAPSHPEELLILPGGHLLLPVPNTIPRVNRNKVLGQQDNLQARVICSHLNQPHLEIPKTQRLLQMH